MLLNVQCLSLKIPTGGRQNGWLFTSMTEELNKEFTKKLLQLNVEEKVVVIHRGRCNNKVYYRYRSLTRNMGAQP